MSRPVVASLIGRHAICDAVTATRRATRAQCRSLMNSMVPSARLVSAWSLIRWHFGLHVMDVATSWGTRILRVSLSADCNLRSGACRRVPAADGCPMDLPDTLPER